MEIGYKIFKHKRIMFGSSGVTTSPEIRETEENRSDEIVMNFYRLIVLHGVIRTNLEQWRCENLYECHIGRVYLMQLYYVYLQCYTYALCICRQMGIYWFLVISLALIRRFSCCYLILCYFF